MKCSFRKDLNNDIPLPEISVIGTLLAAHVMLELGCHYGRITYIFTLYFMEVKYAVYNLLIYAAILSLIIFITGKIFLGEVVFCFCTGIIAIINYYVIQWHGTPLTIQEVQNAKTAFNVLRSYRFVVYKHVGYILIVLLISIILNYSCNYFDNRKRTRSHNKTRKQSLVSISVELLILITWGYNLIPEDPVTWDWRGGYQQYGYAFTTISRAIRFADIVIKPEGYDEFDYGRISSLEKHTTEEMVYPDIILILNESFYDPRVAINIETDAPYLGFFNGLDRCIKGYAVVPLAGGGTNKTEYELLTSNSMELLPDVTPFNVLNLSNAESIVSFLKQYGYYTIAMHPGERTSYNREYAFECLGFNEVNFSKDFLDLERYKDRVWPTDESVYQNMIRKYEETAKTNEPIFLYMLTLQNHGGYETSDQKNDIIHVSGEYSGYEDELNEYLTSISLSDAAFHELIDYFSNSDRQVVVCMLGDHCPDYMQEMVHKTLGEVDEVSMRSTPFVIWSNYNITDSCRETVSVNYLAPMLCEEAGLPLSAYYHYLLDLKNEAPVLTAMGYYISLDGQLYQYQEGPVKDNITVYHYMEYDRIKQRYDFDKNIYK